MDTIETTQASTATANTTNTANTTTIPETGKDRYLVQTVQPGQLLLRLKEWQAAGYRLMTMNQDPATRDFTLVGEYRGSSWSTMAFSRDELQRELNSQRKDLRIQSIGTQDGKTYTVLVAH